MTKFSEKVKGDIVWVEIDVPQATPGQIGEALTNLVLLRGGNSVEIPYSRNSTEGNVLLGYRSDDVNVIVRPAGPNNINDTFELGVQYSKLAISDAWWDGHQPGYGEIELEPDEDPMHKLEDFHVEVIEAVKEFAKELRDAIASTVREAVMQEH